jgi:uncharacterized protein YdiU (UPF0061 family)
MKPTVFARNLAALHPSGPAPEKTGPYSAFLKINGQHPWKYAVPNGFIDYPARILRRSKVVYFNFALAKEMKLIENSHTHSINPDLEKTLIETFALRILNEYDQLNGLTVPRKDLKNHRYMATRYLQLQHENKTGSTSGDGRSIWNGQFLNDSGEAWDVSSCGTGVTQLSPGFVYEGKPVKTGDKFVSYGSGLADVDEGLTAAILSENYHARGILTERTLLVIEGPDGRGINVRAAKNLLRPSHLFLHLKQNNQLMLKSALDFFIARQIHNKEWIQVPKEVEKYDLFLKNIAYKYAKFTAQLEDEYVFCWLDWDGDNMLMDGGIIDYGSIRQFGLCHHHYRYDDVDRYSTNLKEQKRKARYLVQTFIQLVDFVQTGQKKDLKHFSNHEFLSYFDQSFRNTQLDLLLKRVGIAKNRRKELIRKNRTLVESFEKIYRFFERKESSRGIRKTPDGINNPVIFCTRTLLKELPRKILITENELGVADFLSLMQTSYLTKKEASREKYYGFYVKKFQTEYLALIRAAHKGKSLRRAFLETTMRASKENPTNHVTGDGIIYIVDNLLNRRKNLSRNEFFKLVDAVIYHQKGQPHRTKLRRNTRKIFEKLLQIIEDHKHTI